MKREKEKINNISLSLAEGYTNKYYPEDIGVFYRIKNEPAKSIVRRIFYRSKRRWYLPSMGFDEANVQERINMTKKGISIFVQEFKLYNELMPKGNVAKKEMREYINKSVEIKCMPKLGEFLIDHFCGSTKNKINIDYSKKIITLNNNKELSIANTIQFRVLETLLLSKRIHWSIGYVLSNKWRKTNPTIESFRTIITRINSFIGFDIAEIMGGTGYWKLNDRTHEIESTIFQAENILKEVKELPFSEKSIKKYERAIELYPDYIEAYVLIIDNYRTIKEAIPEKLLNRANLLIKKKVLNYRNAIDIIKKKGNENNWERGWCSAQEYLLELSEYLKIIERCNIVIDSYLSKNVFIEDDEIELISIKGKILAIEEKRNNMEIKVIQEFEVLSSTETFREVFTKVSRNIMKKSVFLEITNEKSFDINMLTSLIRMFEKGYMLNRDFSSLTKLKNYFIKSLTFRTEESIIESRTGIDIKMQREIRKLVLAEKNIMEENAAINGKRYDEREILEILKWDKKKLVEVRANRDILYNSIPNVEEHWLGGNYNQSIDVDN